LTNTGYQAYEQRNKQPLVHHFSFLSSTKNEIKEMEAPIDR